MFNSYGGGNLLKKAGQDEPHTQKPTPDPPVKLASQIKSKIRCSGNMNPRTGYPLQCLDEAQHWIIAAYQKICVAKAGSWLRSSRLWWVAMVPG